MPLFKKNKNTASNEQMQPRQPGSNFDRDQFSQNPSGGPTNQGGQNLQGQAHGQDPLDYSRSTGGATGAGGGDNPNIPPAGHVNHQGGKGGGSHALTGRVEQAVGSIVGSNALKAKGMQKQQEVNSINLQGEELAAAENLEREALMRRERAVAHGAHPINKHLGGNPGAGGAQDFRGGLGGQQQGGGFTGQQPGTGQAPGGHVQQGYGAQTGGQGI
ncbi:hypothetical protein BJ138DRAFT_1094133 [Hygrophoropsis aurantiaca]|uniref:Uncharacterized protein n=1 Tax=Hygrophoropsis aurantiaca TaxID=72124 RepID=A0ACB8A023_9AGAM|nr:hypothetical protein BJ138DRAFT_1094133 [Hygrophoropsis aurantiaca]